MLLIARSPPKVAYGTISEPTAAFVGEPVMKPFLNLRGKCLKCWQRPVPVVLRLLALMDQLNVRFLAAG